MTSTVYANGREISCKESDGKSIAAFPDVCLTPPSPPAGPIPIPYPNTGLASDTTNGSSTVKISGKEVMLKDRSYFKKSSGDEAATRAQGMNVVTHQITGKVYFRSWSMDVVVEGENVVRHLDLTTHNHASDPPGTPPTAHASGAASGAGSSGDADKTKKCREMRAAIMKKYAKLGKELRKYDPIADAKGGFPMRGGVTKPCGHYKEIKDLQRGLKNDLNRFNEECKETDVKVDRNVDRMANQTITRPPGC